MTSVFCMDCIYRRGEYMELPKDCQGVAFFYWISCYYRLKSDKLHAYGGCDEGWKSPFLV